MAGAQKLSVEDRLDIEELFAKYCWGIDTGDVELVLSCFAEDGFLDHLWQGQVMKKDIPGALKELWYDRPSWWIGRQHRANHFLIEPNKEGARVRAFFSILQHNIDYNTDFVFGIGHWDNQCVKRDGAWLFKVVCVHAWRGRDGVPWVGDERAKSVGTKVRPGGKVPS
jgi:SnoaL-like domain